MVGMTEVVVLTIPGNAGKEASEGVNSSVSAVVPGGDVDDSSPYEPVAANRQPDTFRLASISSGTQL